MKSIVSLPRPIESQPRSFPHPVERHLRLVETGYRWRFDRLAYLCMSTATALAVGSNWLPGLIVVALPLAVFSVVCAWRCR